MKLAYLDAETLGADLDLTALEKWGTVSYYSRTFENERVGHVGESDIVVVNKVVLNESVFAQTPNLKLICLTATGYNNIDLPAARKRGIAVCNVVGYSTASVAQHTFAILLSLIEKLSYFDRYSKTEWARSQSFTHLAQTFVELSGKNWGIVGLGEIGKAVARIARSFGCNVAYYSSSGVDRSSDFERKSLNDLLAWSDVLSIHSPLNEKTSALIGEAELARMKPTAYLVNVGRGGIVVESALAHALDAQTIAGAAIDVLSQEPPPANNPLLHVSRSERLLLTPHIAWASVESRRRCLEEVERNIESWTRGERRNRVD